MKTCSSREAAKKLIEVNKIQAETVSLFTTDAALQEAQLAFLFVLQGRAPKPWFSRPSSALPRDGAAPGHGAACATRYWIVKCRSRDRPCLA